MISFEKFALAGNATFTITSNKTNTRFTFKIRKPEENSPWFVKVLTGNNNENDYTFLGTIFQDNNFRHGSKSPINRNAPSAKAFNWLWMHRNHIDQCNVQIHHEGKCCRCGRTLTVPQSCELGIGPECAEQMGF